MKRQILIIVIIAMVLTSLASLIGYIGGVHWLFDLFVHFKLQYLIILTIGSILLFILKQRKILFFFLIPIITNFTDVSSLYIGGNSDKLNSSSIKICSINILSSNREFKKFGNLILNENPDLIILQEINPLWQLEITDLLAKYKFREEIIRNDNFGIAIYSKIHLENITNIKLGIASLPSIQCEIKIDNGVLNILATHPLPPVGKDYFYLRNSQLEALAKITANTKENFVILGDLNTSSYSNQFKYLIEKGKLYDSRKGFGIHSSWPTWFPLAYTTLDHCLITKNVIVKSRNIGQDIGSDHLPVIIELGLKTPK